MKVITTWILVPFVTKLLGMLNPHLASTLCLHQALLFMLANCITVFDPIWPTCVLWKHGIFGRCNYMCMVGIIALFVMLEVLSHRCVAIGIYCNGKYNLQISARPTDLCQNKIFLFCLNLSVCIYAGYKSLFLQMKWTKEKFNLIPMPEHIIKEIFVSLTDEEMKRLSLLWEKTKCKPSQELLPRTTDPSQQHVLKPTREEMKQQYKNQKSGIGKSFMQCFGCN